MRWTTHSIEETWAAATEFLKNLRPGDRATMITLCGGLGTGKTTFVQGVAKELGIAEQVTSPTFVIMKKYETKNSPFKHLIHVDAYRLASGKELHALSFKDISEDPGNLVLIEWPEQVTDVLGGDIPKVNFTLVDHTTREIEF